MQIDLPVLTGQIPYDVEVAILALKAGLESIPHPKTVAIASPSLSLDPRLTTVERNVQKLLLATPSGTVSVDPAGAITGDGSSSTPLAVAVDGSTVSIVGNKLVATAGGAGITQLTGGVVAGPGVGSVVATVVSVAGASGLLVTAQTPRAHAASHASGGSDPVTVTTLAGFPGGTTTFLRADGTFAAAGSASHALLDGSVDSDTVAYTVLRGSMIIGNSTPKWGGLAIGGAGSVLNSNGTDPSWNTAVVIATSVSVPAIITAAGALTVTPAAGSNLNIVLSTTGDFTVNTNAIYVDTSAGGGAGWVGIGTSTPAAPLDIVSSYASDNVICGMTYYSADGTGPIWRVKKARGTPGSPTIVAADDVVGRMAFQGYDGSSFLNTCFIDSEVDGTPSAGHMPGRLTFSTNNNTSGAAEVMRLDHVGRMFVGTPVDILTSFVTLNYSAATYNGLVINDLSSATSAIFARFAIGSTQIGNIQRNAATSAVLYNTTSDARLKTDRGLATDLSLLKALRVHDFAWNSDGTVDRNVFAQEAYAVSTRGVSVGTDERNANGEWVCPWGVEKATYVPDLIVGWQDHEKRLSDLEQAWLNR